MHMEWPPIPCGRISHAGSGAGKLKTDALRQGALRPESHSALRRLQPWPDKAGRSLGRFLFHSQDNSQETEWKQGTPAARMTQGTLSEGCEDASEPFSSPPAQQ